MNTPHLIPCKDCGNLKNPFIRCGYCKIDKIDRRRRSRLTKSDRLYARVVCQEIRERVKGLTVDEIQEHLAEIAFESALGTAHGIGPHAVGRQAADRILAQRHQDEERRRQSQ